MVLCILLDLLFALGKNTVKKEEDFKRLFSVKSLGTIPHAKFHKRRSKVQELWLLIIREFQGISWKLQEQSGEDWNGQAKRLE